MFNKETNKNTPDVQTLLTMIDPERVNGRALVTRAYASAEQALKGRKHISGEPYFLHSFETARTLAEFKMDAETIAAGLLHGAVEENSITEGELKQLFGKEVAFLTCGISKLSAYKYRGVKRHAESMRKFLLAISLDPRILVAKLASLSYKMKTLGHVNADEQKRIALEVLEIYAPIAHRLGMGQIQGNLEDSAFMYVYPKEYEETLALRKLKSKENQRYIARVSHSLQKEFASADIKPEDMSYRLKHLYSLYGKLKRRDMDIDKVYDIAALRIIVEDVANCYRALGIVHSKWKPVSGRIKDYIAAPKPNGYQSLHTSIFTGDGGIAEIQIRTKDMHREAEYGIASHLAYKATIQLEAGAKRGKKYAWIRELSSWRKKSPESKSGEFFENLKNGFFKDRVFVFTPKGDIIDLPKEATLIDFAYAVHTDIGDACGGAKINGKLSSLDTVLKNEDTIEVMTKKKSTPSAKWLAYAKTALAQKHIRTALAKK